MTQHTPSPWTVQRLETTHHGYAGWQTFVIRSPQNVALAVVGHLDRYESERIPANASLIAQAPAMREVLAAVAAFQFSPIAEGTSYGAALGALCALKRQARAVLMACEGGAT